MISRLAKTVWAVVAAVALCDGGNLLSASILLNLPQPVTGETLVAHLTAQLASRTNGNYRFTGPTDGSNYWQAMPTNKPDFWLIGVTNIFAQSQINFYNGRLAAGLPYLTAIAPHFCVCANHVFSPASHTNEDFVWLLPNGGYFTNRTVTSLQVSGTDIEIVLMAGTNWTTCKIFPDATSKIPFWSYPNVAKFPPPVFVRFHQGVGSTNQFHTTFVSSSYGPGNLAYLPLALRFGDYTTGLSGDIQHGDSWISGDSSGAAYAIINNEAALIGTAYTGGYCPPLGLYTNEVNSLMATLCAAHGLPAEAVTLYDLSQFPDL